MASTSPALFADRLAEAMERTGSLACVGLDPVIEKIPKGAVVGGDTPAATLRRFCEGVLDAVAGQVPVVKFQSGCFERHGPEGVAVLNELITRAKSQGLLALLDAKRGDIGVTAEHYAHAVFHVAKADALTVSPYLGMDTLEPYFTAGSSSVGLFVLVRTSNPGSDGVQNLSLADGRTLAEAMGGMVTDFGRKWRSDNGLSSVGAVVGATKAADATRLRAVMPDQVFLVPGYGAQGGTADDIRPMLRSGRSISQRGVLVTASRSVIYPSIPGVSGISWTENIRAAAAQLNRELAQILK
ncbi:MAG: orotidine-5'-phosphate decarboxylase [Phycisphaerales bacterium]